MPGQSPASPRGASEDQMRSKFPGPADLSMFDGRSSSILLDRVPDGSPLREEGYVLSLSLWDVVHHGGKVQQPGLWLWQQEFATQLVLSPWLCTGLNLEAGQALDIVTKPCYLQSSCM